MATTLDSFLTGTNAAFIAELYARYLDDPATVDASWVTYFSGLQEDGRAVLDELSGASWAPSDAGVIGRGDGGVAPGVAGAPPAYPMTGGTPPGGAPGAPAPVPSPIPTGTASGLFGADQVRAATKDSLNALMMIRAYRVRGHLIARFDPLGLEGNTHHP